MTPFTFGILDADGLRGTELARRPLADLLTSTGRLSWTLAFATRFPEFRRLDLMSRAVTLATEAAGLDRLSEEDRLECAILLSTALGCLDADLEFQASLARDERTASGLFPHTLASSCLSSVAIRHRLQGPTVAWVTDPERRSEAFAHAIELIESEEATSALLIIADALSAEQATRIGSTPQLNVVAVWGEARTLRALGETAAVERHDPIAALIRSLDDSLATESP